VPKSEPAQVMEIAQLLALVGVRAQGDLDAIAVQELRRARSELHVAPQEQIDPSIAVRIEKAGAGSPRIGDDAALARNIDKTPAALVPEQHLPAVAGDQQVRPAVVVDIGDRTPVPAAGELVQAGLMAHVPEPLPALVA